MRMLFINPVDIHNEHENCFPSLGLGYLVSSLRCHFDIEYAVVKDHVLYHIKNWKPDIVCITSVSQYYNVAMNYAATAKRYNIPVIIGGTHISALPQTMTNDMDIAVLGEGEHTIVRLMSLYLAYGGFPIEELNHVEGIAFKHNGNLVTTPHRTLIEPLDNISMPMRSILNIRKHTSMFTSRGCPYRCSYCFSSRYWDKVRFFSAEYVVNEISYLAYQYRVERISLLDDLFIADRKRLEDIVQLLGKQDIIGNMSFICNVRSNLVDIDLAELLHVMGIDVVGMGIESACQKTLEYLKGKGNITVHDHANALHILRSKGIAPHPSFIIGAPDESEDDIKETIKFIKDNRVTDFEIYVLVPFPGTPVWDYALSRGLVNDNMKWGRLQWDFGTNPDPVMLSTRLSHDTLSQYYTQLIDRRQHHIRMSNIKALPRCAMDKLNRVIKL